MDPIELLYKDLIQRCPEILPILNAAKEGQITEDEALQRLVQWSEGKETDPALVLTPPQGAQIKLPASERVIHTEVGNPRLHPLFEAALIARSQFDGDIPELRLGPLPPGMLPSLSVDPGTARDPVVIGTMMEKAQQVVGKEIQQAEMERRGQIGECFEEDRAALILRGEGGLATVDQNLVLATWGSTETDHPLYRRGKIPAPVVVRPPPMADLVKMSPQERQEAAWKVLSTTQGRRSAIPVIAGLVMASLMRAGYQVKIRAFDSHRKTQPGDVLAYHEWTRELDGSGSLQESQAFLDLAALSIYKSLVDIMDEDPNLKSVTLALEMKTIQVSDHRRVGWGGRILQWN